MILVLIWKHDFPFLQDRNNHAPVFRYGSSIGSYVASIPESAETGMWKVKWVLIILTKLKKHGVQ